MEPMTITPDNPLRVLSLGAGVQSTTVALMALTGAIEPVDAAIFADTGWEPPAVYEHLFKLAGIFAAHDVPLHVVTVGNIREDALDPDHRFASMPLFVRNANGKKGMIRRQCTSEYKLKPINRKIRELVGLRPRWPGPRHIIVDRLIGISWDETSRMRDSDSRWAKNVYPLVDLRMTRDDCHAWLADHGWTAPRSACIGCPFHSDEEWIAMREKDPSSWADAVEFDEAIRAGKIAREGGVQLLGEAYLHSSLRPLADVALRPEDAGQINLFEQECAGMCGT